MADLTYYKKDNILYELEYELLVLVNRPKKNVKIVNKIQDKYYVKRSDIGKAYYNDEFYFKKVSNKGIDVFDKLGVHPNYPKIHQQWQLNDDYHMIVMTKFNGTEISPNMIDSINGKDYYALVYQTISSLDYVHSLNIHLYDRGSFDNSLYDHNTNIYYHIDVDDSWEKESGDIISTIVMLIIMIDGEVENYRGEHDPDDDNFVIHEHLDILTEFISIKIDNTEDIYYIKAFDFLLGKIADLATKKHA